MSEYGWAERIRRGGKVLTATLLGLTSLAVSAGAETVSYRKGDGKGAVSETDDTYLSESAVTTNYSTGVTINVDNAGPHAHGILKFPNIFGYGVNQIPPGSAIISASLTLYVANNGDATNCPTVYQITEPWTEAQATWNERSTGVPWTNAGADGTGSHKPVAEGVFLGCENIGTFQSLNVTTSVQNWSRGEANEGWVLLNGTLSDNGIDFSSSEEAILVNRPSLSVTFVAEAPCTGGNALWWNTDWGRRRKIQFDNSAQGQDLVDFPVLIRLDTTRVDYSRTQNSGQDIRFVDADSNTVLAHEIEVWNEAGSSYVWVRVPRINGGSYTDFIWMYYDNGTVGDGQNAAGVWDASHRAVWHLKENPAAAPPQFLDSTTNPNDGTVAATPPLQVAGQIHFGLGFTAATDRHVAVADHASLQLATSMTVSAWIRTTTPADASNRVVVTRWGASPNRNYWLGKFGASLAFYVDDTQSVSTPLAPFRDGMWHHLVGVADAPNSLLRIYVDGVQLNSAAYTGTSRIGVSSIFIGANPDIANQDWDGEIDETRVESIARSADWIRAQNLSMRDSFLRFQPELGSCNLRSIGSRADYGTLAPEGATTTVSVTQGSRVVSGSVGTTWRASNRGRGDRINIAGVDYTVFSVNADNSLQLTTSYRGTTASGLTYRLFRQYGTLAAWEDCVDGPPGVCPFFPVSSASLVADNRQEIGIAYEDSVFTSVTGTVTIDGSTTDPTRTITLTADGINRHFGLPGQGVLINMAGAGPAISVEDEYVTVEWLEIGNVTSLTALRVRNLGAGSNSQVVLRYNLIHNVTGYGIDIQQNDIKVDVINNIEYSSQVGIAITSGALQSGSRYRVLSNTIYSNSSQGFLKSPGASVSPTLLLRNNISIGNSGNAYDCDAADSLDPASSHNMSADPTSVSCSPAGGGLNTPVLSANFVNTATGNLHINPGSAAENAGADLSAFLTHDIDDAVRTTPWEIGADDILGTTAVRLVSFEATGADAAVELSWRTASELDNLGFHVYRALSQDGPWTRITSSLIQGLGSSPTGASYSRLDAGLQNGTRYFYRLEDVDTASVSTFHGPVSALPQAGATPAADGSDGADAATLPACRSVAPTPSRSRAASGSGPYPCLATYGEPSAASLRVVSRSANQAVVELVTGGFYAVHDTSGRVRLSIPGFEYPEDPHAAALPFKRAVLPAEVGRQVRLASVRALELERYPGLLPGAVGYREMDVRWDGTVRPGWRAAELRSSAVRDLVRVEGTGFQGEDKRLALELHPLRWDSQRGLTLVKRLRVLVQFTGREARETGRRTRGRRAPRADVGTGETLAYLHTTQPGLHAVSFETLLPGSRRALSLGTLRLERQGEPVAFHVEPAGDWFGPGSVLYLYADRTASSTAFDPELSFALTRASGGVRMMEASAAPAGAPVVTASLGSVLLETNRIYQPGLLEAEDTWQWEALVGGPSGTKTKGFVLEGVDGSSSEPGHLSVWLQGGSDAEGVIDHHLRVYVGAAGSRVLVGEGWFDGKQPYRLDASVPASALREGANELVLESVGDAGVYSLVFLDRFRVEYRQTSALHSGVFEGVWSGDGTTEIVGASGAVAALDVTDPQRPVWLRGLALAPGSTRLRALAGRRYLVVASTGLLAPRVARPLASSLKNATNQADYLLIAPQAFLATAQPLVERRESQGLRTRAVSLEEVTSAFGQGEASGEAIRRLLSYAYHSWQRPSPRYVLLFGDASSDPRNFTGTAGPAPLPALFLRTTYLWTASDPALAAVNGDDPLPDLSIGRLPARTLEEARALVAKLLAWEDSRQGLAGQAVLVADNPDAAGNFEANVDDIRASFLGGRKTTTLKLRELGAGTRPAILDAFDSGSSFMSYVGHGGAAVWASENVLNSWDVASLQPQSQQPLMLTLNCLNGYFVAPAFESLSEAYLKAEGRGTVGAFSPSGLSLDEPAHQFHRAVMAELTSGRHVRLGDALLAAQNAYAATGAMPELLSVYQLLGDPAMVIR